MKDCLRLINWAFILEACLLNFQNVHFICWDPLTAGVLAELGFVICDGGKLIKIQSGESYGLSSACRFFDGRRRRSMKHGSFSFKKNVRCSASRWLIRRHSKRFMKTQTRPEVAPP